MKRGELWVASVGADFAGKPRPVLIIQNSIFEEMTSVTLCPITSDMMELPLFRVAVLPDDTNGLLAPSMIMVDKISTAAKAKLSKKIGVVSTQTLQSVDQAIILFLGIGE